MNGLSLCAGVGGLELGLRIGFGARVVGFAEREAFAQALLLERMEDETLERAPLWGDLADLPAGAFHGLVDFVSSGIPCQPWSSAGKRRGLEDDRWLWPEVWRVARESGARLLFLENSPRLRAGGLQEILRDLAAGGWDAEWSTLPSRAVGAPHRRDRLWVVAYAGDDGRAILRRAMQDSREGESHSPRPESHGRDPGLVRGATVGFRPPPPGNAEGWTRWIEAGGPEPGVLRGSSRLASGLDQDRLRAIGNGVDPLAAAYAFRALATRILGGAP